MSKGSKLNRIPEILLLRLSHSNYLESIFGRVSGRIVSDICIKAHLFVVLCTLLSLNPYDLKALYIAILLENVFNKPTTYTDMRTLVLSLKITQSCMDFANKMTPDVYESILRLKTLKIAFLVTFEKL